MAAAAADASRQLGTRVDVRPSAAIVDGAARATVAAALARHGVVALAAEPGLTPSQLARFVHLLCLDAGGGGLVAATSDIYDACLPCSADEGGVEGGAVPEPGLALALSNVTLAGADAAGVDPIYRARLNGTHAGVDSRLASPWCAGLCLLWPGQSASRGVCASLIGLGCVRRHQDEQFRRLPAAFTLLYPVKTPPPGLADTHFADTALGWDTLPGPLREQVVEADGACRLATHSLAQIPRSDEVEGEEVADPLARTDHEEQAQPLLLAVPPDEPGAICGSGRTSLYLGSINAQVEGLTADASVRPIHCM
jgi:hypothetical protein